MCSVLIGSGRKPIMFENQMKKNRLAMKGNQRVAIFVPSPRLPAVMFLGGQVVRHLTRVWILFGVVRMRRAIQVIVAIVSALAMKR